MKTFVGVPRLAGRILPAEMQLSSKAARMLASEAALRARQDRDSPRDRISPVRRAAPFQAWTGVAEQHVISAAAALRADRGCHPAVGVAAVEAGGSYENIPIINTGMFKGEGNDASRNK